jgi:hypothetical protein
MLYQYHPAGRVWVDSPEGYKLIVEMEHLCLEDAMKEWSFISARGTAFVSS